MNGYFIIWFAATAADAIGLALAFVFVLRLRGRFGNYLAVLLFGVAFEACLAALFWPAEQEVSKAFAITRAIGRVVEMVTVWVLLLYLMGLLNGERKAVMPE